MVANRAKRLCAAVLVGVLATTMILSAVPEKGMAAKKTSLKAKKVSVFVGKTVKILIQGKKKSHTYTFASKNKKIAKVSKKGLVTGVKAGKTAITVKDVYKQKGKKKTKKLGTVQVMVNAKETEEPAQTVAPTKSPEGTLPPAQTQAPVSSEPAQTTVPPQETASPQETETPQETSDPVMNLWPDEESGDYDAPNGYNRRKNDLEYGEQMEITYHSNTTGADRKANIVLPAGYTEEKKYPVLYLLHGIAGDHNEWGSNPKYVVGNLIASGEAKDMILVMPNARARANDAATGEMTQEHFAAWDNFINDLRDDLMPYIKEHYSIAEGRENTAIAGLSMGGRTSLYIGFNMQDTFGYIGAFEPAPGVLGAGGLFTDSEFKLQDEYNGKTVVLIQKGTRDTTVNDNPLVYHNTLTENGTVHLYYEVDAGHEMAAWAHGLYNFAKRIFTKI